jgi:ankyrin repeat protein
MTSGSPRILRAAVASIILATLLGACCTPREADPSDLPDAVRTAVVRLLIRKAADLNAQADDGRTALMEAALTCNKALVESLLENGARKDLKDGMGRKGLGLRASRITQPECLRCGSS